jgi:hypothetical protein
MSARQSALAHRERRWWKDPATKELNARLNASETMLRGRIGDQRVDELIEQFRAAATPALFDVLYTKRDPYRWLARYWRPKQSPTNH